MLLPTIFFSKVFEWKFEEVMQSNLISEDGWEEEFREDVCQDAIKRFSWKEEEHFQEIDLDGLFSLVSKNNDNALLMLAQKLQEQK